MKLSKRKIINFILILTGLFIFCEINNQWLVTTEYVYQNQKIPKEFEQFRIVQISDLHNTEFGSQNQRLLTKIEDLRPDILVITGDIVDANHTKSDVAIRFCEQAVTICPVYVITGNHELWLDATEQQVLYDGIRNSGAVILNNKMTEITKNQESVFLCGLDDASLSGGTLKELSQNFEQDKLTVLLAHEPQYFADYCNYAPDLILTGHAHGGQVRLPVIGGLVAPDQGFFPEYTAGSFTQDDTTMIISRGLGNSVIPVRVFNLPEIVSVVLTADD